MNNLYYWKTFVIKNINIDYSKDHQVIVFYFANKNSIETYSHLTYLQKKEDLLSYLKYYILPTTFVSKAFENTGSIVHTIETPRDVISILESNTYNTSRDLAQEFRQSILDIENIGNKDFPISLLLDFQASYNSLNREGSIFNSGIFIFENLGQLLEALFKKYKGENKLRYLEEALDIREADIIDFDYSKAYNIEENIKFFLKKEIIKK